MRRLACFLLGHLPQQIDVTRWYGVERCVQCRACGKPLAWSIEPLHASPPDPSRCGRFG